ncbi:hypothetical protein [Endozoicomonas sp. ALD040]|uniref:hypothetical protein n=1 Tax=Endozoicomonas sp. ALD040 TaxID=3403079 RepID=UPI003BAE615B
MGGFDPIAAQQNEPMLFGGSGYGLDDDDQTRRPPWMPFQTSNGYSLTLLPNLQLPPGLGDYLPDLRTWYTLLDYLNLNANGGLTVLLRNDLQPDQKSSVIILNISAYEQKEMKEHLTNARALMNWLAPKLNGREELVQLLLAMLSQTDVSQLDENARALMQEQLAELLETGDHALNLELHLYRLEKTVVKGVLETAPGKPASSGKQVAKNSGSGSGGKASPVDQNHPSDRGSQESRENSGSDEAGASGAAAASQSENAVKPVKIVLLGAGDVGKSSIANRIIGYSFFKVGHSETYGLPGNENGEPPYITPHLEIRSLPGFDHRRYRKDEFVKAEADHFIGDRDNIFVYVTNQVFKGSEQEMELLRRLSGKRLIHVFNQCNKSIDAVIADGGAKDIKGAEALLKEKYVESYNQKFGEDNDIESFPLVLTECVQASNALPIQRLLDEIQEQVSEHEKSQWEHYKKTRYGLNKIEPDFNSLIYERLTYSDKFEDSHPQKIIGDYLEKLGVESKRIPELLSKSGVSEEFEKLDSKRNPLVERYTELKSIEETMLQAHNEALEELQKQQSEWLPFIRETLLAGVGVGVGCSGGVVGALFGGVAGFMAGPAGVIPGAKVGGCIGALLYAPIGMYLGKAELEETKKTESTKKEEKENAEQKAERAENELISDYSEFTLSTWKIVQQKIQEYEDTNRWRVKEHAQSYQENVAQRRLEWEVRQREESGIFSEIEQTVRRNIARTARDCSSVLGGLFKERLKLLLRDVLGSRGELTAEELFARNLYSTGFIASMMFATYGHPSWLRGAETVDNLLENTGDFRQLRDHIARHLAPQSPSTDYSRMLDAIEVTTAYKMTGNPIRQGLRHLSRENPVKDVYDRMSNPNIRDRLLNLVRENR